MPKLELTPESVRYSVNNIDRSIVENDQSVIIDTLTNLGADDIWIGPKNVLFSTMTGTEAKRVLQFLQQLVDKNAN